MNHPKVSVIIPAYNSARWIKETIESVLKQSFTNYEIIVIDDESTDDTPVIVNQLKDRLRYFRKPNGGPASARNLGIREARGELIAFLDADDLWHEDKLQRQIESFESDPTLGLIYTATQTIDEKGNPAPSLKKSIELNSFIELFQKNKIATSSVMIRKQCLSEIGLLDEDPEIISVEDYDLWLRLAAKYKMAYILKPLLLYRVHSSGISRNIAKSYLAEHKVLVKNFERFKETIPTLKKIWPRRLSRLYFEFGYDYFYQNNFKEAHRRLKESLEYWPWNGRAWIFYFLTTIDEELILKLKRAKREIKS